MIFFIILSLSYQGIFCHLILDNSNDLFSTVLTHEEKLLVDNLLFPAFEQSSKIVNSTVIINTDLEKICANYSRYSQLLDLASCLHTQPVCSNRSDEFAVVFSLPTLSSSVILSSNTVFQYENFESFDFSGGYELELRYFCVKICIQSNSLLYFDSTLIPLNKFMSSAKFTILHPYSIFVVSKCQDGDSSSSRGQQVSM